MHLIRGIRAAVEITRVALGVPRGVVVTGEGVEASHGARITGTGVDPRWELVSAPPKSPTMHAMPCFCNCRSFPLGYVFVPKPIALEDEWNAWWAGNELSIRWTPAWDFDGDGWIGLLDLCRFGLAYARGELDLVDFSLFAELYNRPAFYWWRYRRAG